MNRFVSAFTYRMLPDKSLWKAGAPGPDQPAPADCLPVLFANRGYGWCVGLTSRFAIRDVLGITAELCREGKTEPVLAQGVIR